MLFISVLALLFPLAFYCLALGTINRREQPLLLGGSWDCVGLLFALSGLLLIDGPWLINWMYDRDVKQIYKLDLENAAIDAPQVSSDGQPESVNEQVARADWHWWLVRLGYFAAVVAGAGLLVWSRRRVSVLYNIDEPGLQEVLTRALERLGLKWHLEGGHLLLRPGGEKPESVLPDSGGKWSECEVNQFPSMCHATLHWRRDPHRLREPVEEELALQLKNVRTFDNPAAVWLLGIACCLFGLLLTGVVFVLLSVYFPRGWRFF